MFQRTGSIYGSGSNNRSLWKLRSSSGWGAVGGVCSSWAVGHSRLASDGLFQRAAAHQLGWVQSSTGSVVTNSCQLDLVGQVTPTCDPEISVIYL